MVQHVILWTLKEECNTDAVKREMKTALEGLVGVVPGLLKLQVAIEPLATANCDVMLYSEMENEDALKGYAVHPVHVEVGTTKVRPFVATRMVMDCVVD